MEAFDRLRSSNSWAYHRPFWRVIRWNEYIRPGPPVESVAVSTLASKEKHTATQFRALGGGKYEAIPGTGIWKDVVDTFLAGSYPMKAESQAQLSNLGARHPSERIPDGQYRITPTLKGTWSRADLVQLIFGSRTIEPKSASVVLKKDDHIGSVSLNLCSVRGHWR